VISAAFALVLAAAAQTCPLHPVAAAAPLAGHALRVGHAPPAFAFTSGLERDEDGAPNAYHRGLADDRADPGLDSICEGGSVMQWRAGRLIDRYDAGGSVGAREGTDRKTGLSRARLCKRDYLALRDAGFPACGPGRLCMLWYGVAATPRRCGWPSAFGGAADQACGVPILQPHGAGVADGPFYVTTTALQRPGAADDSRVQSDNVDAAKVPYIVLPGGLTPPEGLRWRLGDLAAVQWHGRVVYAVVGDIGPPHRLGEASRALLARLRPAGVEGIDADDPATTVVFPGTHARVLTHWPLTAAAIAAQGRAAAAGTGLAGCKGLGGVR
jgi:hypothetical protein